MQRQTQLANELWPLLLQRVTAVAGAGGAAGGSAAGVTAHSALTGLLGDDHPQYLRVDGARALTGNLGVAAGATVDGVDISAHASDPDAHHARQHGIIGGDHTVSGSQYQIVGLPAANTLGLLTPSATPAANTLVRTGADSAVRLVELTVTDDLFCDGVLDFGTNTLYEDATYLRLTGSKALLFAQNIGNANWTIYNAGGASFSGNVDIISGGDLYVAGSGVYAGNPVLFADSSGGNVGIMRVPDPQFALDVAGPARATWFVGPHAIQVAGATMICHFDGPGPAETNFVGELNGHMGQQGTAVGGVAHRPGKFGGKGLMLSLDATNRLVNPSFEVNVTDGWTAAVTGTGGALVRDTVRSYVGGASARITASSGGNYVIRSNQISLPNGDYVTVQCRMRRGSNVTAELQIRDVTNGTTRATVSPTLTDEWEFLTVTWRNQTGSTVTVELRVSNTHGDGSARIWVDACQMETTFFATPYLDGSLSAASDHTWAGTAHNSASSRTAALITYPPTGIVRPSTGTIMAWVLTRGVTGTRQYIVDPGGIGADGMYLSIESDGKARFYYSSSSTAGVTLTAASAVTAHTWVHIAGVWGPTGAALYVNGVSVATDSTPAGGTTINAAIAVGRRYASAATWFNGLIDDLVFRDRATTATEMLTIYESNAPVFAESSVWNFRATPKGLVWADDEGLWMRDTTGNPVLGVYGGEAASKSWAGFTLAVGDLVIGRNAVGSAAMMWDQSTGKFGWYGAGGGTPQVEIGTDGRITAINGDFSGAITATSGSIAGLLTIGASGEIRQGSGTLGSNYTGLRIWNDSGIGRIGGYNSNTLQWYADTSGAWKAGGGAVVADANGLTLNVAIAQHRLRLMDGANLLGYIEGFADLDHHLYIAVGETSGKEGHLQLAAHNGATILALMDLNADGVSVGAGRLSADAGLSVDTDAGGVAGKTTFTDASSSVSTGTGTVKMAAGTARNSDAWVKIYIGTTAYWLPAWSNIS